MSSLIVPVIDFGAFTGGGADTRREVARAFGYALETTGFVTVINHGVPPQLMQEMYDSVKSFFGLPEEIKNRYVPPEKTKGRGYLPMGIESVAATLTGETPPDLCEALVFRSLQRERRGLGVPNLWPEQPVALSACVNRYFDALAALCAELMKMAALALELPEAYFDPYYSDPSLVLRFVNYPDQAAAPKPGQLRYGAHHDYGGLTVLRQDNAAGGLEICDQNGDWHDVPCHPDSFVINVGSLMSRWTNGRWRSTLHRVVNPGRELTGSTQRLSLVVFSSPNEHAEIACLSTCHDENHPVQFPPVQAGEYIRQKLAASMELTTTI
jgi:isopenicillin N synthase-like dioxygenase